MSPELALKLGLLLGTLDTILKGPQELSEEEVNRLRGLSTDIKKLMFAPTITLASSCKESNK